MSYQPPFTLTDRILNLTSRFSEKLGNWTAKGDAKLTPALRRSNRIKTIQASLEIEQNTLSIEQVRAVIEGKAVLGPPSEIQEVKNAILVYEKLPQWKATSQKNLLEAHRILMSALLDDAGSYRKGGVGVYQNGKLIHMGPPPGELHRLMKDLFHWLAKTKQHPLLASCLFHYEFEFIHPFSDGNGRIGRLWQTMILSEWHSDLAWLPVETIVRDRQDNYYAALAQADNQAEATIFVEFMLEALMDALEKALADSEGVSDEVSDVVNIKLDAIDHKILNCCREMPYITQEQLAERIGKSLSTIQRRIRKLKQQYLFRIGSDKTGYWQVMD